MIKSSPIISVVIPLYNESSSIQKVLLDLSKYLEKYLQGSYEIIAINDGSTDNTEKIISVITVKHFKFYSHPYNKGYGAAIKTGVKVARGEYIIIFDGDGQHIPKELNKLLPYYKEYEMVIGSREKYNGPIWRKPGKKIITLIANYLVSFKILDLNSGLRIFKKNSFNKFVHLYPQGFSLSTTITLAFIKHGFSVKYVPINVKVRDGKSTVKITDGFKTINLVLRMIMLFAPARIFIPFSLLLIFLTLISFGIDIIIYNFNLSESTMILFISSIFLFFIGLLADQIAAIHRNMKL